MAEKLLSTITVAAGSPATEIPIPPLVAPEAEIAYIFDGNHANDVFLVDAGETDGLRVPAGDVNFQSGPWKRASGPRYLYYSGGTESVKLSIVRIR